jgi:GMP synthase (glutamine-hydrolysing)
MFLIIDNGSQYTHLIKRGCRELGYEAETLYSKTDYGKVEDMLREGVSRVILSGGPSSVYTDPPNLSSMICQKIRDGSLRMPLLGVCYGHQMIAHVWGAKVEKGASAEYGMCDIAVDDEDVLFKGVPRKFRAWVSHYDQAKEVPKGFVKLAHSDACPVEAMRHAKLPIYGVQFHPEVWHTENGETILKNFLESGR